VKSGIFSTREIEARHEILLDDYIKKIQIESRIIGELVMTRIVPAVVTYQNTLLANLKGLQELGLKKAALAPQMDVLETISTHVQDLIRLSEEMRQARKAANLIDDARQRAMAYCDQVRPHFDAIRDRVDRLELMVDDEHWPLPKYWELLFIR
jgi:glutamine synthetase